jgi:hypothetical protein
VTHVISTCIYLSRRRFICGAEVVSKIKTDVKESEDNKPVGSSETNGDDGDDWRLYAVAPTSDLKLVVDSISILHPWTDDDGDDLRL